VDVSTGVERAPGLKDPKKVRAFVQAVRDLEKADESN
jgi:phosphoribosylanthranilate isomerase